MFSPMQQTNLLLLKKRTAMLIVLTLFWISLSALNDMPIVAQLTGEHNYSGFGMLLESLDFNHDGYEDLIVLALFFGYQYQQTPSRGKAYIYYGGSSFGSNSVPAMTLEGDYDGVIGKKVGLIENIGDINGDGFDDLMIADAFPNVASSARYMIYFGGSANLNTPDIILLPQQDETINLISKLGDVDGDGYGDLGIVYTVNYAVRFDILWGGSLERQLILSDVGMYNDTKAIIGIGDINNDNLSDFAIGYRLQEHEVYSSEVRVYYGNIDRAFGDYISLIQTSNSITRICKPLGDLNGDGYDDFLGYIGNSGMNIWLGTEAPISTIPNLALTPVYYGDSTVDGVQYGDFNGDGYSDVVGASYSQQRFAVWLGSSNMDGRMDLHRTNTHELFGYDLATGDFTGDGYDDIAFSAPMNQMGPVWEHPGYVFIYAGNAGMIANDDPISPSVKEQLQLRISPNPIRRDDQLISIDLKHSTAVTPQPTSIEIYNIKGQSVLKEERIIQGKDNELQINPSSLKNGVYLCKITSGKQSAISRFSIVK